MKKKIVAVIAGALMTMAASNAMAYFEDGHLIRVVVDTANSVEIATDLGAFNVKSLATAPFSLTLGNGANAFTNFASTDFSKLSVAYYAVNSSNTDLWLSNRATTSTVTSQLGTQWPTVKGSIDSTYIKYAAAGTSTVSVSLTDSNSYKLKLDAGTTKIGRFAGAFSTTNSPGEMNLSTLATAPVTTNLYFWDNPGLTGTTNTNGSQVALITTNSDGSTVISGGTPVSTPIPAAAWLLGSGLLGMVGIRRKSNKA